MSDLIKKAREKLAFAPARDEASQLYCIDRTGNKYTDPLSFRAGADWGYEKGRAEMQAEIRSDRSSPGYWRGLAEMNAEQRHEIQKEVKRLERELAEAKRMLDYERSAVDRLMECEANEAAQKGQYRAKVERLTAENAELRAERDGYRQTLNGEGGLKSYADLQNERDATRAMCEKLAEALEEAIRRLDGCGGTGFTGAASDAHLAKALAAYRDFLRGEK